ncbi:MAG: hypothetical protein ACLFVJ_17070 [Persicimonas sp.]
MHPLVARIHPSYRTALLAWFVTRALMWLTSAAAGHTALIDLSAEGLARGGPAWSLVVHAARALDGVSAVAGAGAGALALTVVAELTLLAASIGVYRFVRRDQLPQTAERATWLWAACPAMVWTLPVSDWTFAVSGVALALWALSSSRHALATAALVVAMAFKPEAMLVWPGIAFLGIKNYSPGKQHAASPWLTALGPLAAFTGLVLLTMSLAGRWGVSLRTMQSGAAWRTSFEWQGPAALAPELLLLAALAAGIWLAVAYFKQCPKSWPLMALPALAWPLLHQPPTSAAAAILIAVPFFAYLARATSDPTLERPVLAGFLGGLLLMVI